MKRSKDYHQNSTNPSTESTEKRKRHNSTSVQIKEEIVDQEDETHGEAKQTSAPSSAPSLSPSCSRVQVKKEEVEDNKCDIKVEPQTSSPCTANDIKPVIIKHEFKKEEYDSDCDCNDCRVAKGKTIKITANDVDQSTQDQTDKHNDDSGCNECVQDRQVGDQVTHQANQGANDQTVGLTDQPTGDDVSRSSTPDWMPSIFSDDDDDNEEGDDDETEDDDKTIPDERDDDDDDPDFSVNDEEKLQNDDDDTQEESDCPSGDNQTPVPVKRKAKESKGKSRISMAAKYKCLVEGCTRAFKKSSHLKRHNKVHTRERPFACTQCKSKFSTKAELTRHVQYVHQNTKRWRCCWPGCKNKSAHRFGIMTHIKNVHLEKSDDKPKPKSNFITVHLNCLDCSKTFKTRKDLKQHQLKTHRIQQFRCLVKDCSASFSDGKEYLEHRSVKHRSCRVWPCRECGSEMSSYHNLSSHFRLQHQKGRFVCAYTGCTVETDTIRNMATHTLAHKPATHRCTTSGCNQRFKARKDLEIHERIHTGIRPFACTQCDKRCISKCTLTQHIRANHQSKRTSKNRSKGLSNKKKNSIH